MRKDKLSLKSMAILVVVLVVLSVMLTYLVLRKQEGRIVGPCHVVYISLGHPSYHDEWDIVEWSVVSAKYAELRYLTFKLEDEHGNIIVLKGKTVSLSNFTAENLKNDTEYQLYFYDAYENSTWNEKGSVDAADAFMVKAPSDGYYKMKIIEHHYSKSQIVETHLIKF